MKRYSYRHFEYDDDLIDWLNENQHINNYIEGTMPYQVFYYTEEEERVAYQPNNDGYRSSLYGGMYGEYNRY